jgi:hypothetical protein
MQALPLAFATSRFGLGHRRLCDGLQVGGMDPFFQDVVVIADFVELDAIALRPD